MNTYSNEALWNASKHLDWRLQFNNQNRFLYTGKGNSEDDKKVGIDEKCHPWTEKLVCWGGEGVICFSLLKQIHFQCSSSESVVPCSGINLVTCYAAKLALLNCCSCGYLGSNENSSSTSLAVQLWNNLWYFFQIGVLRMEKVTSWIGSKMGSTPFARGSENVLLNSWKYCGSFSEPYCHSHIGDQRLAIHGHQSAANVIQTTRLRKQMEIKLLWKQVFLEELLVHI